MTQSTKTNELIEALEKVDERASVKIMVKDYADGWYELKVSRRPNVEQLRQALATQPQAETLRDEIANIIHEGRGTRQIYAENPFDQADKILALLTPAQPSRKQGKSNR